MTPYIFHFYFRGFGLVLAVTGKCFSLLCIFFGSIPDIAINLLKVAHRVAFFDFLNGGDGHWVKSKTKDVCKRVFEDW